MNMLETLRKLKRSYNARILLVFIGGMVSLAIGLDLLFIHIQRKSYTEHTRHSGLATARLLAQALQVGVFSERMSVMIPVVDSLLLQDDIFRVVVINSQEEVLLDRRIGNTPMEEEESYLLQLETVRREGNNFLNTPQSFVFWWPVLSSVAYSDEDELYFRDDEPDMQEKKLIGWVAVSSSKEKFEIEVRQLVLRTGILVATVLFLAILCTVILLNKMMLPLRDLVNKVGSGEGSEEDRDEIGLLDTTYSMLLERLEHSFATIDELRLNLEQKVELRTSELALANKDLKNKEETLKESNASLEQALREIKEAHAQLIHSEKMAALGQLVAGVAHEVNNNINFIVMAAPALEKILEGIHKITDAYHEAGIQETDQEMLAGLRRAETLRKELGLSTLYNNIDLVLGSIREGCSRSVKIVSELTSFSRQDSDYRNVFDVNEALLSTWKFVDTRYKDRVQLVKELAEIPQITCAGGRINQVFLNIMNNGIQAIPEAGGTLTLTTFSDTEMVHIRFVDTGHGISKEDLPRIFDPFFTRKEVGQGTGLGLGICYKIIAQHHGKIRVESDQGSGTALTISLPIHADTKNRPECELSLVSR
jgi:signal transduction histidine kinase